MPIIVPEGELALYHRLLESGAAVIPEAEAAHQDIRPARIGILNLMPAPAMENTEKQWLRYISHTVLQIEPVLIKFDEDFREREGASRSAILERYTPFAHVAEVGLDGLVVTGDNLELKDPANFDAPELLSFSSIHYASQLFDIVDWARHNVRSTVYSCLASHIVLQYLFDIKREVKNPKIFGVFEHNVTRDDSEFTLGMDDVITAPHSRWGNVSIKQLEEAGIRPLAVNDQIGWLLAEVNNEAGGTDLLIQGHPEYDRLDLHAEYTRDCELGQQQPVNYYVPGHQEPRLTWANDARALHTNWVASIYSSFS